MIVIFKVYIFLRIFKKRESSKNIYNTKNSTFTVVHQVSPLPVKMEASRIKIQVGLLGEI